jgi:hypothetical protein
MWYFTNKLADGHLSENIYLFCGHLSENISEHLSDIVSIDSTIYVDNWATLTTSTCTHL